MFDEVGGFKPIRMAGDSEMWHRLALQQPVVLMNQGVVWYRAHDDQESNDIGKYESLYEAIRREYLSHPHCPLSPGIAHNLRQKSQKN